MDKRYQVFVSSTYTDLLDARQQVMHALLELDCMPAGMELFPATDEDSWTLIKQVIDECDYYLVIIGGRYGSVGADGMGYTEKEYRYAVDKGMPVIGFVHADRGRLPADACEATDEGKRRLADFETLVKLKNCKFWDSPSDLGSKVSRALVKLIKSHPAIGWVRGDQVGTAEAAQEILRLRNRIDELENRLIRSSTEPPSGSASLAQDGDEFAIDYSFEVKVPGDYRWKKYIGKVTVSWSSIFAAVAPSMMQEAATHEIEDKLGWFAMGSDHEAWKATFPENSDVRNALPIRSDTETILVQLRALGLVEKSTKQRSVKDTAVYWTLTAYGDRRMTELRAIKRPVPQSAVGGQEPIAPAEQPSK